MFARLVARGLWQRKSRVLIALAALTVSATLTAALSNLHLDALRKIRSEFSRYGPNVMITPRASSAELLPVGIARELRAELAPEAESASVGSLAAVAPYLYAIVEVQGESVVLAGTWLDDLRAARIRQMIEANDSLTQDYFGTMHTDALSLRAVRCVPKLLEVLRASSKPKHREAADVLAAWDCRAEPDRVGAAIFEVFFAHWIQTVASARFEGETATLLVGGVGGLAAALRSGQSKIRPINHTLTFA